jgi:hypothetical protein
MGLFHLLTKVDFYTDTYIRAISVRDYSCYLLFESAIMPGDIVVFYYLIFHFTYSLYAYIIIDTCIE